jgi:hypothetical protein
MRESRGISVTSSPKQPSPVAADNLAMKRFADRNEMVLYLWDYFYCSNTPVPGDEAAWAVIERATCRIRESEISLDAPTPIDVRLRSARRARKAAHLALREIERLSVQPERWVVERLAELVATTDTMIEALSKAARDVTVH